MGICGSILNNEQSKMDELEQSMHGPKRLRQGLARHREDTSLEDFYDIVESAGEGSVGSVSIVRKKLDAKRDSLNLNISAHVGKHVEGATIKGKVNIEGRKYACKTINASSMTLDEMTEFINEIDILRDLDHPNIVQLFEVLKHNRKIWIIMELCNGGDLSTRMSNMSELQALIVMKQVLHAVAYMHTRGICHRDIKLENILFETKAEDSPIKLIDFGLSNRFTRGEKFFNTCGTIYTAAPELILGSGFTEQTDMWSIGCVTYMLLSGGQCPFLSTYKELENEKKLEKLREAHLSFGSRFRSRNISKEAKDFIAACLRKDPGDRWSVMEGFEFLRSVWLPSLQKARASVTESESDNDSIQTVQRIELLPRRILDGIIAFSKTSDLKKLILMIMAYEMEKSLVKQIRDVFISIDKKGNGTLSSNEFSNAIKSIDTNIDDNEINFIFQSINQDKSGQIHWNEWLAALLECQGLVTVDNLVETFDRLDIGGNEFITKEDIKTLLGTDFDEIVVDEMMANVADVNEDGKIHCEQFVQIMLE